MKNFWDINDEKITEKAFSQHLVVSIVSILLCLVALCSITYAWFSGEQQSVGNQIVSGTFALEIGVVKNADGMSPERTVDVTQNGDSFTCELTEAGVYTFTLTRTGGSTANGYCYVTVGAGEAQPTETIADATTAAETDTNPFTFTITTDSATTVELKPWWGIHTNPVIFHQGTAPALTTGQTE